MTDDIHVQVKGQGGWLWLPKSGFPSRVILSTAPTNAIFELIQTIFPGRVVGLSTEETKSLETRRHWNGHPKWGLAGSLLWLCTDSVSRSQMGEEKQAEQVVLDCEKLCMPDPCILSWKQREQPKVLEHRSAMCHLQLRKINAEGKALALPPMLNY